MTVPIELCRQCASKDDVQTDPRGWDPWPKPMRRAQFTILQEISEGQTPK